MAKLLIIKIVVFLFSFNILLSNVFAQKKSPRQNSKLVITKLSTNATLKKNEEFDDFQATFFTGKNFTGEAFTLNNIGDFPVEENIKILSVKISKDVQVTFEFDTGCNSFENGTIKFLSKDCADIFTELGCSEDFSKINKVIIRPNMNEFEEGEIIVYEKPYLQGNFKIIKYGKFTAKELGLLEISSLQLPPLSEVRLYSDEDFKDEIGFVMTKIGESSEKLMIPMPGKIESAKAKSISFYRTLVMADPINIPLPTPRRRLPRRGN
ncbi:hypothetical protein [Rufibacter latericius]|uniref:Uncharacterized protein n=1 Tax=Rufibacter latericius TaxID=2487040 RepID=A0A3M9MAN9_9BACT|nr:hypothetical protein [Rufibacter latericius]RNI22604.1 hypothetical protein EFB08_21145 [Rufibacter latericius]